MFSVSAIEAGIRDFGLLEFGADVLALVCRVPVSVASAQHRPAAKTGGYNPQTVARMRF